MQTVRVGFSKKADARYISHLDLMRLMTRALRRAQIPVWFTEGFNPHAYINFPLPLSLGVSGEQEFMDIRLTQELPGGELLARLNRALPPGIQAHSAAPPAYSPKEIAFASYEIELGFPSEGAAADFCRYTREMLGGAELTVLKKCKSGHKKVQKPVNILPHIQSCGVNQSGTQVVLRLVSAAGLATNLNPSLLLGALAGEQEPWLRRRITRSGLLTADMRPFC